MTTDDPASACYASFAAHKARLMGDPIGQRLQDISMLSHDIGRKIGETLGVNLTDMGALKELLADGPLTPGALAARLKVTTAAATQIVDRLERAGHVRRQRQAGDRRKVLVVPVAASVERAFDGLAPMLNGLDGVIAGLGQGDRQVIEQFLDQVIDVYRNVAGFPPSASEPL